MTLHDLPNTLFNPAVCECVCVHTALLLLLCQEYASLWIGVIVMYVQCHRFSGQLAGPKLTDDIRLPFSLGEKRKL